ncbi:MAG: C40 family peptidase [Enhygromyxa sp.]
MRDEIDGRLAALREQLCQAYGWTHVELRVALEPSRVRVTGTVAVPSLAARVRALLEPCIGPSRELELELRPMPVLSWHRISAPKLELWAEHPSLGERSLATELLGEDGPIGLLAEAPPGTLVRARDGTVGWLLGELGPDSPPRPLSGPRLPDDPGATLVEAARAYLGVPYQLGGTSFARIDCSGLVARAYAALGIVLPRNSRDQLAIGASEPLGRAEGQAGDLLFMRSRALGRSHVGLATGRGTVIHASRSRDAVLEEPAREFESDAEGLRRVRRQAVVEWSRGQIGRAHVELPTA